MFYLLSLLSYSSPPTSGIWPDPAGTWKRPGPAACSWGPCRSSTSLSALQPTQASPPRLLRATHRPPVGAGEGSLAGLPVHWVRASSQANSLGGGGAPSASYFWRVGKKLTKKGFGDQFFFKKMVRDGNLILLPDFNQDVFSSCWPWLGTAGLCLS